MWLHTNYYPVFSQMCISLCNKSTDSLFRKKTCTTHKNYKLGSTVKGTICTTQKLLFLGFWVQDGLSLGELLGSVWKTIGTDVSGEYNQQWKNGLCLSIKQKGKSNFNVSLFDLWNFFFTIVIVDIYFIFVQATQLSC